MSKYIKPIRFQTISAFHKFRNIQHPEHPLFSIIDVSTVKNLNEIEPLSFVMDFFVIGLKRGFNAKLKYGQEDFDFDEGVLSFTSPGQVLTLTIEAGTELTLSGFLVLIHPDFLWNTSLAAKIKQYEFFDYKVNEALFLSDKEEKIITGIIENMGIEYKSNIDKLSCDIMILQIETLLAYSERFYQRQFITRMKGNSHILSGMETLLDRWFEFEEINRKGLPTVAYIAAQLNVSPAYLGEMLRTLTGMNTQQHIHVKVIAKAKELLSTTSYSISEIGFQLGFEHLQSFSKLFKAKTQLSPSQFRQSFN